MGENEAFLAWLGEGLEQFRSQVFPARQALFEALATGQTPRALVITCADSRLSLPLLTNAGPGDLFVERNPGNLVPIHSGEQVGVSASIEYAMVVLGIEHVIVMGHTDCGAVKGIFHPEKLAGTPAVGRWLEYGAEALARARARTPGGDEPALLAALTEENVLLQLEHLHSHPSVQAAEAAGRLTTHGWVYEIRTGEVRAHDPARGGFFTWPPRQGP